MTGTAWPPRRAAPYAPYVKICGLTTPALAAGTVAAGADMVGVVHFPPSPRHLEIAAAREVADAARGAIVVALTVDADDATLDAFVAAVRPDALQLHGKESPARVVTLAARYGLPVAKAIGVASASDLDALSQYDALPMLDAKPPKGADRPGGHGAPFDWSVLEGVADETIYMLSGGLDASNVAEAVALLRPYAVDVSSRVETHGVKDLEKVAAFIAAAKGLADGHQ